MQLQLLITVSLHSQNRRQLMQLLIKQHQNS